MAPNNQKPSSPSTSIPKAIANTTHVGATQAANPSMIRHFKYCIASMVVRYLSLYWRSHIKSVDKFKHIARKITHVVLIKELKRTETAAQIGVTSRIKRKTKGFIQEVMAKGPDQVFEASSPETFDGE